MNRRRAIRALALVPVAVAVVVACAWDGPTAGVQVVPSPPSEPTDGADVDVPVEAVAGTEPGLAPTESLPPSTVVDGSIVTIAPGGRRQLPPNLPPTVVVVGDSLTLSAADEIESALSALGIDVLAVDGAERRRMVRGDDPPPGIHSVESIAGVAEPDLWVLALGTNDVGAGSDAALFADDAHRLLERIPDGAPVVWVDLWIRDRREAIEDANSALRDVLDGRRNTIVADWYSRGDDPGLVGSDGVHLTAAGQRMFAATIVDAVLALSS